MYVVYLFTYVCMVDSIDGNTLVVGWFIMEIRKMDDVWGSPILRKLHIQLGSALTIRPLSRCLMGTN